MCCSLEALDLRRRRQPVRARSESWSPPSLVVGSGEGAGERLHAGCKLATLGCRRERDAVRDPWPARGLRRGSACRDRRSQAARPPCLAPASRERGRLARPVDRRALGRDAPADCGEDASGSGLTPAPVAQRGRGSRAAHMLGPLQTRGHGYLLKVEPGQVDADRFQSMLEEARRARAEGKPDEAAEELRRGARPLAGPRPGRLRLRAVRTDGDRAPGRAATDGARGAPRGRPRARPPC